MNKKRKSTNKRSQVHRNAPNKALGRNEEQSENQSPPDIQTNKKGFIEVRGEVIELLPSAMFKVKLDNEHEILCHLSGKMRMNRILLLPGDKVKVEMTPYDMSKGRITYRF